MPFLGSVYFIALWLYYQYVYYQVLYLLLIVQVTLVIEGVESVQGGEVPQSKIQ